MTPRCRVGVDGCPGGWVSVGLGPGEGGVPGWDMAVDPHAEALWRRWAGRAELLLVDIPTGLPEGEGGRTCDREARRRLGPRRSSVFPAPCRGALATSNWEEASRVNRARTGRGLSRQSWHLLGKIGEVDRLLARHRGARGRVREAHPELLFWALRGGVPAHHPKRSREGLEERLGVLEEVLGGPAATLPRRILAHARERYPRRELAPDDVVDALAGAVAGWVAGRWGCLRSLPETPPLDGAGRPMEMVFPVW